MVCVFHVAELWWACSKFPCAWRDLFTLYWVWSFCPSFLAAWRTFSCRLTREFSTSDFESPSIQFPGAWQTLFLSSSFLGLAAHHQIHRSCFCCRWTIVRGRVLSSFRHGWEGKIFKWLQEYIVETHYIAEKMIPLITCEISFGQNVSELVLSANLLDLDFGFHDSVKQPIKSNSVGSGNVSHCRASSLYDHLDHCFVVFKDIQQSFLTRRIHVWGDKINIV